MSPSTCCTTAHIHNKPLRCRFCECNVLSLDEAGMRAIYRLLNSESRDARRGFGGRCGRKSHTIAQMWGEQRMPSRHRVAAGTHLLNIPTLHSIWSFSSDSLTLVFPESCFHSCFISSLQECPWVACSATTPLHHMPNMRSQTLTQLLIVKPMRLVGLN